MENVNTCRKCSIALTSVTSQGLVPAGAPDSAGVWSRSVPGTAICLACLRAAQADRDSASAAKTAQRDHRAAQAARFQPAPPAAKKPARRKLSARAREIRDADREADRLAAGGHPWAHDEE